MLEVEIDYAADDEVGHADVEFFRNQKAVGWVMRAEQKLVDSPMTLPFTKTASQIALNTGSGLIACLSGLVEKFQDDGQCRFRNIFQMLAARHRLSRDMAVNPLHGIGRSGGKASGKHCTREWGCQLLQPIGCAGGTIQASLRWRPDSLDSHL